jgi:hypothetical protein
MFDQSVVSFCEGYPNVTGHMAEISVPYPSR